MLKILGIPESQVDEIENTTNIVIEMFKTKMGIDLPISTIDRSHRLGVRNSSKPRTIIVKFSGYSPRNAIYINRKNLKNTGIFINEHLTLFRSKIMYVARQLKKANLISNAWSSDGRLLVKDKADKVHIVSCYADLAEFDPDHEVKFPDALFDGM